MRRSGVTRTTGAVLDPLCRRSKYVPYISITYEIFHLVVIFWIDGFGGAIYNPAIASAARKCGGGAVVKALGLLRNWRF